MCVPSIRASIQIYVETKGAGFVRKSDPNILNIKYLQ